MQHRTILIQSDDKMVLTPNSGFLRTIRVTIGVFIMVGFLVTGIVFMAYDHGQDDHSHDDHDNHSN